MLQYQPITLISTPFDNIATCMHLGIGHQHYGLDSQQIIGWTGSDFWFDQPLNQFVFPVHADLHCLSSGKAFPLLNPQGILHPSASIVAHSTVGVEWASLSAPRLIVYHTDHDIPIVTFDHLYFKTELVGVGNRLVENKLSPFVLPNVLHCVQIHPEVGGV
jgi:hypothetical protein